MTENPYTSPLTDITPQRIARRHRHVLASALYGLMAGIMLGATFGAITGGVLGGLSFVAAATSGAAESPHGSRGAIETTIVRLGAGGTIIGAIAGATVGSILGPAVGLAARALVPRFRRVLLAASMVAGAAIGGWLGWLVRDTAANQAAIEAVLTSIGAVGLAMSMGAIGGLRLAITLSRAFPREQE